MIGVEPESPAERAGILEGNLIVGFADQPITGVDDLHRLLTESQVGAKSLLTVLRGQELLSLEITPAEAAA